MKTLHVGVVIPCLNEEATLLDTATSLGFGGGEPPSDAYLVLVDNGSKDNTLNLAKTIQARSPKGRVLIGHEPTRGYVPPRHRGNLMLRKLAAANCIPKSAVLVLQADADTFYSKGYIDELRHCSLLEGPNVLVEGCSNLPVDFLATYRKYVDLCNKVDEEFSPLLSDHPDDVIVDDKTCGYRLSDYFLWGGHRREFSDSGDEIHAETTRLYIRSKRTGCVRVRATNAVARHSMRKEIANPSFPFATAGFPRETAWHRTWKRLYKGTNSIQTFPDRKKNFGITTAIDYRKRHLLALFLALPLHVSQTLGDSSDLRRHPAAREILSRLPRRSKGCCFSRPGVMIEDALHLVNGKF